MCELRQDVWTYIGQRISGSGNPPRMVHKYAGEDGNEWSMKKAVARYARPGARYRVTMAGESSIQMGGEHKPEYVGMHDDEEQIAAWTAAERADQAKRRRLKAAKNDMEPDRLAELLRPLAEEYRSRDATGRRALIATVIEYMTTGRM